jgi:thiosulfate reductase cytochrome b subunit
MAQVHDKAETYGPPLDGQRRGNFILIRNRAAGDDNLGLGRHGHFLADLGWLLTGLVYVVMLFRSPEWRRLIPVSWKIVPDAGRAMLSYLTLHVVETPGTYNALQRLSYAAVVFLLTPFSIATGVFRGTSESFTDGRSPGVCISWLCADYQYFSQEAGI